MFLPISKAIINVSKPISSRLVMVRTNYMHGSDMFHQCNIITGTCTQKCYILIEQFSHGHALRVIPELVNFSLIRIKESTCTVV